MWRGGRTTVDPESLRQFDLRLTATERALETQARVSNEILWAQVFDSTIQSSSWLHDKAFSPGRWAVGYPYLYVMYRILNEIRPRRILDLGLGQSTRMITQYAAQFPEVEHVVVEHDERWIEFFSRNFQLSDRSKVVRLDWDYITHGDTEGVRVYGGLAHALSGAQFDFISIDGPLGGDMETYARIDVLRLLPDCLMPSFAIMIDDYERPGEQATVDEMRELLSGQDVQHQYCLYSGAKDLGLLCSSDLGFLCSL